MKAMCTVVIPVKNRHKQLKRAVRSALLITVVNQVIVVDDASEPSISSDLFFDITCNEIILIKKNVKNPLGGQGARVCGAEIAKNDIIIFLDSDDVLLNDGVLQLYSALQLDNSIALAYANVKMGAKNSDFIRLNGHAFRPILKNLSLCPFSGLMVRRSLVPWSELEMTLPAWQDDDFVLTVSKTEKIIFIDTFSALMIGSEGNISGSKKKQFIGLSLLLKKWGSEIAREHGTKYLLIWRIRQLALYFFSISQYSCTRNTRNLLYKYFWYIYGKVARLIATKLNSLIRKYFDRIYV